MRQRPKINLANNSLKVLTTYYKTSWQFVIKHKWLYLIPFLFLFPDRIFRLFSQFYVNPLRFEEFREIVQVAPQSFWQKLAMGISSIQLTRILDNFPPAAFISFYGLMVFLIIFYRRFEKLFREVVFLKKYIYYFLALIIFGFVLGTISFFFKTLFFIILGVFVGSIGLVLFMTLLLTILEGVFLFFIRFLLLAEKFTIGALFSSSGRIFKTFFGFNLVLVFTSTVFWAFILLLPDVLNASFFGNLSNFIEYVPHNFDIGVRYVHGLFTAIFLFVPVIIVIKPSKSFFVTIQEALIFIRRYPRHYLSFIMSGVIGLLALSLIFSFVIPTTVAFSWFGILMEMIATLVFVFFLITFFVIIFRFILDFYSSNGPTRERTI